MESLKVITSNVHKFQEIKQRLSDLGIELVHVKVPYMEVQADLIRDIAIQSATTLLTYIDPPFMIEDSGIEIIHLKGFPGPYSSYVFRTIGWQGILNLMKQADNRSARFISTIVLVDSNRNMKVFEGFQEGEISLEGKGSNGFGFDPIFIPEGTSKTYAQMDMETKNHYSHRGKSTKMLYEYLEERLQNQKF